MRLEGFDLPVQTARLILRRFRAEDFTAFAAWRSSAEVYRYLYAPVPGPEAIRERFDAALAGRFAEVGDVLRLAVETQEGGMVLGELSIKIAGLESEQGEIGYVFAPESGGKGYATEAVAGLIGFGFAQIGFHRLFARLDALNQGSVGVMERLALRREAHLVQNDRFDGRWGDEVIHAVLRAEWEARAAAG